MLQRGCPWRLVPGIVGLFALVPGLLYLRLGRRGTPATMAQPDFRTTLGSMRRVFGCGRFWLFLACMPLASGIEHSLLFWMPTHLQTNWPVGHAVAGLGTALFAAGMFTGRLGTGLLMRQSGTGRVLATAIGGLFVIALATLLLTPLPLFLAALFLLGVCTGPVWPGLQNHCLNRLPDLDQTTMLTLLPCAGAAGFGLLPWLTGLLADHFGGTGSFVLLPVCAMLLIVLLLLEGWLGRHSATSRPLSNP